jgi:uncharacterized protein (DUF4415 family)
MMQKGDITMSTIKDNNETFDYQAYTRENAPDPAKIQRGPEARRQRLEAAIMKSVLRIDKDILQQFKQLAPSDQECQRLINQALREWLAAKDVKELVRAELQHVVRQALALIESKVELPKSNIEKSVAVEEG